MEVSSCIRACGRGMKKIMRIIITHLARTVLRILEGSVLGPLIYIIYSTDLDTLASSDVSNFADGIKTS